MSEETDRAFSALDDEGLTAECTRMLLQELEAGFTFCIEHFSKPVMYFSEGQPPRFVTWIAKINGIETCNLECVHTRLPYLTAGENSAADAITDVLSRLRTWKEIRQTLSPEERA